MRTEDDGRGRTSVVSLTVVIVLALVAAGGWSAYAAQQRNDQYQLITLGECVADGGRLYVDCWENKPPGIAWINALATWTSGGHRLGVWIAPVVMLGLVLAAFWWFVHVLFRRLARSPADDATDAAMALTKRFAIRLVAACLAVIVAATVTTLRLYDSPSINPDFYSSSFELLAGCLLLTALTGERCRWFFAWLAGFSWSAAFTVKLTGVVGLLAFSVVGVSALVINRGAPRRLVSLLAFAWVGFIVGIACVIAGLYVQDLLQPAREAVFTFNQGLSSWAHIQASLAAWSRAVDGLAPLQAPLWLALVGLIAMWRFTSANVMARSDAAGHGRDSTQSSPASDGTTIERETNTFQFPRSITLALVLWWVVQTVLALVGPSLAMRYWQATFPPMILLAALGLAALSETYERIIPRYRSPFVIATATALWLLAAPMIDGYRVGLAETYAAYADCDPERRRLGEIAAAVRNFVPRGERIYVLAYDAGVYVHAQRLPASRLTYPRNQAQMDQIITDLESGRARAILVPDTPAPQFHSWCDQTCQLRLSKLLASCAESASRPPYVIYTCPESR